MACKIDATDQPCMIIAIYSDFHMRHLSVSFLVLAIWYWSFRRLVLEYLLVGTGVSNCWYWSVKLLVLERLIVV